MTKTVTGPPFTVERYGSLGESIMGERDWLRLQLHALQNDLTAAGLENERLQQEIRALDQANGVALEEIRLLHQKPCYCKFCHSVEPGVCTCLGCPVHGIPKHMPAEKSGAECICGRGDRPPSAHASWCKRSAERTADAR